jgi:hypothetical protein
MTYVGKATQSHVPSRDDNPFATCWTRPGALPFHFFDANSSESLLEKLAAQNWWGAVVGPHGSGKTTLFKTLKPALSAKGHRVHEIALRDGQRRLPQDSMREVGRATIVMVDGYEQLGWFARANLRRRCRRLGVGLVVATHLPVEIPTLIRLAPSVALVQQLVSELSLRVSTKIASEDVVASHASHGSNVREIFFDLYDRHERLRRTARTGALSRA